MKYPNERDCEHGSMRGKCNACDDAAEIAELKAVNAYLDGRSVTNIGADAIEKMCKHLIEEPMMDDDFIRYEDIKDYTKQLREQSK